MRLCDYSHNRVRLRLSACNPSRGGITAMQDIMIAIRTDDFEAWKQQHYLPAASRARYGVTDGPAYRDLDDPGAALFHISVEDMDTAMGWFRSDTFKEATRLGKVN